MEHLEHKVNHQTESDRCFSFEYALIECRLLQAELDYQVRGHLWSAGHSLEQSHYFDVSGKLIINADHNSVQI